MTLRSQSPAPEPTWLTKREAAAYLRCGLRTLERRMAARQVR